MPIQKYNLPDKNDPHFPEKLVDMIRTLFENADNPIKNFSPLDKTPEVRQHGDIWFDSTDNKFKVHTPDGIKTVKYE